MPNLTSSLTVHLNDDVSGPAGKAAAALHKLGASGSDLKKLAASSPEAAKLVKQLEELKAASDKLKAFKDASKGLGKAGEEYRTARQEVGKLTGDLTKAKAKLDEFRGVKGAQPDRDALTREIRGIERALRSANVVLDESRGAWRAQGTAVRTMRNELLSAGVELGAYNRQAKTAVGRTLNLGQAQDRNAAATARVTQALARREASASLSGRVDPVAEAMSGATGRRRAGDAASRRMIDGMGAPAAEARAREAARADAHAEREAARTQRSAERREAAAAIGAATGLTLGHKGKEIGLEAINSAARFDYAVRYQHAVTDVSEEDQQRLLVPQAKRIGQETKFSNEDIVEAQTATMQGLPFKDPKVKAEVGSQIVDNARYYAVLFKASMEKSSENIRSFLQNTNKDISTPEKAAAEAQRATNLIVKAAKLGGANNEDVQHFLNFGVPTGTQAGFSDTTSMALMALARRSGLKGDQAGVFLRSASSKLIAPTREGREAEIVAGIDRSKYQKMPEQLSNEAFEKIGKGRFGLKLNDSQRTRLSGMFRDGDLLQDEGNFVTKVSDVVGESFDKVRKGPNKGKLKAQDAAKIAKLASQFYRMSVESTDVEGLLDAHMSAPAFTPALRNKFYTDKHGGKAGILGTHFEQFKEDREALKHVTQTPFFARDKSDYLTKGLGGAVDNVKGSFETAVLSLGVKNAPMIQAAADGLAMIGDTIANLPDKVVQAGTALTLGAGSGAVTASALAMWGQLTGSAVLKAAGASVARGTLAGTGVGAIAQGGYTASEFARGAVQDRAFADPYLDGGMLGADPAGYGLGAAIVHADKLPGANATAADPVAKGTKGLAEYKSELAGIEQQLAGLKASGEAAFSPDLSGLEAKKAELETAISGIEEKLKAVAQETIAPKFDGSGAQAFGTTIDGVTAKAKEAGAMTIAIPISAPGAGAVISQLTQIISLAGQAKGAMAGVGGGGSSGAVRQAQTDNH